PPLDGPAEELLGLVEDLLDDQRRRERDGVADGALLRRRRHHDHLAQLPQLRPQRPQPRRVNAVVVGQQDAHPTTPSEEERDHGIHGIHGKKTGRRQKAQRQTEGTARQRPVISAPILFCLSLFSVYSVYSVVTLLCPRHSSPCIRLRRRMWWYCWAKRWASSRTYCSSRSAAAWRLSRSGSASPGR